MFCIHECLSVDVCASNMTVYVRLCVCVFVYVFFFMSVCINVCVRMCTWRVSVFTYEYECMSMRACEYVLVCVRMCVCMCLYVSMCTCMYVYIFVCMPLYMCAYVCAFVHICVHVCLINAHFALVSSQLQLTMWLPFICPFLCCCLPQINCWLCIQSVQETCTNSRKSIFRTLHNFIRFLSPIISLGLVTWYCIKHYKVVLSHILHTNIFVHSLFFMFCWSGTFLLPNCFS